MASIINALRNISSDTWWLPKILFLSIPIFFVIDNNVLTKYSMSEQIVFLSIFALLYLGVVGVLMNRNINNKSPLLPSFFSLPDFFAKMIGLSIIAIPLYFLYYAIMINISSNIVFEPFVMFVIYTCVTLFLSPFVLMPQVLYCANGKLKDAFNLKLICEGAGNFSVGFLLFVIEYAFTILIVAYLFYRIFTVMVEDSTAVNVVYSLTFVVSILTFYSFISDMYDQEIPRIPDKKKKEKKLRQPDETDIIY